MPTTTTNLAMTKPDAGQSNWAGLMNANLDILDAKFPGGLAGISSIGLSLPGEFSISGSPLTANGTITGSWVSQAANKVFAAPSGGSGTPGFRLLVASDIPALAYVTGVGASVPSWLSVSGSPVTGSGTLAITAASGQTQNQFIATPDGSSGAVGLRSIVAADVPDLSASYLPLGGGTLSGFVNFTGPTSVSNALIRMNATGTGVMFGSSAVIGLMCQTNGWISVSNTAGSALQLPLGGLLGWSTSTGFGLAASDLFIGREGTRILRIGTIASASPGADTLQIGESSRSGTDSNVGGSGGTTRTGLGTGTGALPTLIDQTPTPVAAGTGAQIYVTRRVFGHSNLAVTNNTATTFVRISANASTGMGIEVKYTVEVKTASEVQIETGVVYFANVTTSTPTITVGTPVKGTFHNLPTSGTLAVSFSAAINGSSVDCKITSNSSLTPTSHRVMFEITNLGFNPNAMTLI